jgi:SAM-dependent methyltransferase
MRLRQRRRDTHDDMRPIGFESPFVYAKARLSPLEGGGARLVTAPVAWQDAVSFPVHVDDAQGVLALVEGRRGAVEVNLMAADRSTPVSTGQIVSSGETRLIFAQIDNGKPPARWLSVRNAAQDLASECDIRELFAGRVPRVYPSDGEAALALRNPAAANESCVRRAWPEAIRSALGTLQLPLRVEPPRAPFLVPPPRELWSGPIESVVLGAAEDLIGLLEEFQPEPLESHVALLSKEAMRSYLKMNVVRVVRVVESLRRRGMEQGTVLEVGSWFGSFSLALRRLGYDVVACDRYSSYGRAFDRNVTLMQESGIQIVSTDREAELDQMSRLGQFDVVLAAAVVEHVPHTPRLLLETLFRAVRPGGLLVLDTPNLARYWNRRALQRGETVFQPLADQYEIEPPWEGHHREFIASEVGWMLERLGCDEVDVEFVDYNMLQFDELWTEHTECLAKIIEDPTQSDTLLATGRRPVDDII